MVRIYQCVLLSHLALLSFSGHAQDEAEVLRQEAKQLRQQSQDLKRKSADLNTRAQNNSHQTAQNLAQAQEWNTLAIRYSQATAELTGLASQLAEENKGWMAKWKADEQDFLTSTQNLAHLQAQLNSEKSVLVEKLNQVTVAWNEAKNQYLEARHTATLKAQVLDSELQDTYATLVFEQNQRFQKQLAMQDTFDSVLVKRYITLIGCVDALLEHIGDDLKEAYEFIGDINSVVQDFEKLSRHIDKYQEEELKEYIEGLREIDMAVTQNKPAFSKNDNALMSLMSDIDELYHTLFIEAYKLDNAKFANERLELIEKYNSERKEIATQIHSYLTASQLNRIICQFKNFLSQAEEELTQHLRRLQAAEYEKLNNQTVDSTRAAFANLYHEALVNHWTSYINAHLVKLNANLKSIHDIDVLKLKQCGQGFYKTLLRYLQEIETSPLNAKEKQALSTFLRVNGLRIFVSFLKDVIEDQKSRPQSDRNRALFKSIASFQVLPESKAIEVEFAIWLNKITETIPDSDENREKIKSEKEPKL